jgi:endoglucanase
VRWIEDFVRLLREAGIGYAIWSYKRMSFGVVDGSGKVVEQRIVDAIR